MANTDSMKKSPTFLSETIQARKHQLVNSASPWFGDTRFSFKHQSVKHSFNKWLQKKHSCWSLLWSQLILKHPIWMFTKNVSGRLPRSKSRSSTTSSHGGNWRGNHWSTCRLGRSEVPGRYSIEVTWSGKAENSQTMPLNQIKVIVHYNHFTRLWRFMTFLGRRFCIKRSHAEKNMGCLSRLSDGAKSDDSHSETTNVILPTDFPT